MDVEDKDWPQLVPIEDILEALGESTDPEVDDVIPVEETPDNPFMDHDSTFKAHLDDLVPEDELADMEKQLCDEWKKKEPGRSNCETTFLLTIETIYGK